MPGDGLSVYRLVRPQEREQPWPKLGQRRAKGDVQDLSRIEVLEEIGQALVGQHLRRG